MEKDQFAGAIMTYSGALSACGLPYVFNESFVLVIFSALGASCAFGGLLYTVWNGNRNYRLAREQNELRRIELERMAQNNKVG